MNAGETVGEIAERLTAHPELIAAKKGIALAADHLAAIEIEALRLAPLI